jgi:hypothetical protein
MLDDGPCAPQRDDGCEFLAGRVHFDRGRSGKDCERF